MKISIVPNARETSLLSSAVLLPSGAELRPQTARRCLVQLPATAEATSWLGWPTTGLQVIDGPTAAVMGLAKGLGFADLTDHMVTDHPFSTRLGSPSCSPPV